MQTIVEIKNAKVYRAQTKVFENLNLSFELGVNTAVLGPNGAGKTTLLKLITREISPVVSDNSSISLFGENKTNIWELRKKIGVVSHEFQNDYLALATGEEVVLSAFFGSVGIHGHHVVSEDHREKAWQIIERLKLQNLAKKQYLQLSTGQQRRLLLARALVHKPQVLIFDEPTNGLDISASIQIIEQMRSLSQQGITLLLVTHHLQEIIPEIQRVIMLKDGSVYKDGDKNTLMKSENLSSLFQIPLTVQNQNGYFQVIPK